MANWRSQIGQDRWVASLFSDGRQGYFVDVGAHDGVYLSNTYSLEVDRGWKGVCIEPSHHFAELKKNRRCAVDDSVVYDVSGAKIAFKVDAQDSIFSGIDADIVLHKSRAGQSQERITRTLAAVLDEQKAPNAIDYMSLDTEGSELKILHGAGLDRYLFKTITVEHNYETEKRDAIHALLAKHGYRRVRRVLFDDWYIHAASFPAATVAREMLLERVNALVNVARSVKRRLRRGPVPS
jgi:FkbM family methyltransferase